MRFIRRFFKRSYAKFQISVRDKHIIRTYREEKSYEQKACAIFRKLIRGNDSKFTIAPVSEKRYIVNKKLGVFIILDDARLEITNHVYHYEMTLPREEALKLRKMFNDRVESDTISYENEIKSNINTSLSNLLEKLNNEA